MNSHAKQRVYMLIALLQRDLIVGIEFEFEIQCQNRRSPVQELKALYLSLNFI